MEWYNCNNSTSWGIEISSNGEVVQVAYSRGDERRSYKKTPLMSELPITEEVLMKAFEAIIRASDEGTHELAHKVKGKDAHDVLVDCAKAGLLILTAKDLVRFLPPLTITQKDMDEGLAIFQKVLEQ